MRATQGLEVKKPSRDGIVRMFWGGGGKLWTKSRSEGDSGAEKEKKREENRKKKIEKKKEKQRIEK